MKIIHVGTLPSHRPHRITCDYCKTIFEILQYEGKVHYASDQRDADRIICNCPTCKREAWAYISK